MSKTSNAPMTVAVGIIFLFLISMGNSYATPLMAKLAIYYPDVDPSLFSYFMSVAFLGTIISSFLAGALTPKPIGYKPLAIFGSVLFCVFGVITAFVHDSFYMVLVFRFLVGLGCGFMTPLCNPLVTVFFEGDMRAKVLSVGSAAAQIGAICMQFLAGFLGDANFWWAFFAPLVSLLSVIGACFLIKEPTSEQLAALEPAPVEGEVVEASESKWNIGGTAWYCSIAITVVDLGLCAFLFNYAFYVVAISDSLALASAIQICYTVGMVVGGLAYPFVLKAAKRMTAALSLILLVAGVLIYVFGNSIPLFIVGQLVAGFGFGLYMPAILNIIGVTCKASKVAFATSIAMTLMNIASFFAGTFIQAVGGITGDAVAMPIYAGLVIIAIMAVLHVVKSPYPKDMTAFFEKQ